jgi:prepilin-type N-terminal cleavage/methylation domain-containing protein
MQSSGTTLSDCGKHLRVEWHDCSWQPVIRPAAAVQLAAVERRTAGGMGGRIKPLPLPVLLPHPARRKNLIKFMKKNLSGGRRFEAGFTLVELLTVIAIIAILAALLLPVLSRVKLSAQKTQAKVQVNDIATAVEAYDSAYGRFPVSPGAQALAAKSGSGDITYSGGLFTNSAQPPITWPTTANVATACDTTNSEVYAILMDYTNFPDPAYGSSTINTNYQKNPQKTLFLNAKMSGWGPSQSGFAVPGMGSDLVYRDPWGNPYIISMDLNYDGQCVDAFYGMAAASQENGGQAGYNGLNNPNLAANVNNFQFHGPVMVWSMGPYGPGTPSASSFDLGAANDPANKNHILSWQQ